jgi:hypothetical protein
MCGEASQEGSLTVKQRSTSKNQAQSNTYRYRRDCSENISLPVKHSAAMTHPWLALVVIAQ